MNNNFRHAEVDVMLRYKNRYPNKKLKLVVWRILPNGTISNSKPCWMCICAIKKSHLPLHEIIYSERNILSAYLIRSTILSLSEDAHPHVNRWIHGKRRSQICKN